VYLGGDHPPPLPAEANREWDLYIAMLNGDPVQVQFCLERGADPFAFFALNHRPSTTDARNCYEYAQRTENLKHLVSVFDRYRAGT